MLSPVGDQATLISTLTLFITIYLEVPPLYTYFAIQSSFMTEQEHDHLKNLSEIRSLMERSTRFISLSGLSGVAVGIWALLGVAGLYFYLGFIPNEISLAKALYPLGYMRGMNMELLAFFLADAAIIITGAIASGVYFTTRKAKKDGLRIWDNTTWRMLLNLSIPLVAGGLFCLIILKYGFIGLIAPLTLIFYGLALINGSKYTLNDIRYLGILEIILGLMSALYLGYGMVFWIIGFGILHILYGSYMYFKYER
jgi:hypothetical protein